MGVTSVLKLRQIVENVEQILILELFCAAQGIDFRRKETGQDKNLGRGTREIYRVIRKEVPFIEEDTEMYPLMRKVKEVIKSEFKLT